MSSQQTRLNIVCVLVSMLLLALPEVSKSNAVRKLCPSNGFLPHATTVLFSRFSKGHAYFSSATLSESTCLGQAKVERSIIGNKHGYWYGMTRACYVLNIFLQLRERLMAGVEFINPMHEMCLEFVPQCSAAHNFIAPNDAMVSH